TLVLFSQLSRPMLYQFSAEAQADDAAVADAGGETVADRNNRGRIRDLFPLGTDADAAPGAHHAPGFVVALGQSGQHQQLGDPDGAVTEFRGGDGDLRNLRRILTL